MDILQMVQELDAELNGRKGLFHKQVDLDKCRTLISEVAKSLPGVLNESRHILECKESIFKNADSVAKNIIREAEERAAHKSDNSEVLRLANRESKVVIDRTYRQCDLLVQKTKQHLDEMFSDVETFIEDTLEMIKKNRNELRSVNINNHAE